MIYLSEYRMDDNLSQLDKIKAIKTDLKKLKNSNNIEGALNIAFDMLTILRSVTWTFTEKEIKNPSKISGKIDVLSKDLSSINNRKSNKAKVEAFNDFIDTAIIEIDKIIMYLS